MNDILNHVSPGLMSDKDISNAIENNEMLIYPFDKKNLTPIGYNFSFSKFIVSLTTKTFVNFKTDEKTGELYFHLKPNETVLVLTKETVWVSKSIGGTFHSKVGLVTKGIGHVSTTLDPGWQGQLLVPINNPTKKRIKITILKEKTGELSSYRTFITLVLYRAISKAEKDSNNKAARIELLEEIISGNKNNKRRDLINVIKTIKHHLTEYNDKINLNSEENIEKKINSFIDNQKLMNISLENNYLMIEKISREIHFNNAIKYILLSIGGLAFILTLALWSYFTTSPEIKGILNILIPVLLPFVTLFLANIKHKYI